MVQSVFPRRPVRRGELQPLSDMQCGGPWRPLIDDGWHRGRAGSLRMRTLSRAERANRPLRLIRGRLRGAYRVSAGDPLSDVECGGPTPPSTGGLDRPRRRFRNPKPPSFADPDTGPGGRASRAGRNRDSISSNAALQFQLSAFQRFSFSFPFPSIPVNPPQRRRKISSGTSSTASAMTRAAREPNRGSSASTPSRSNALAPSARNAPCAFS
ncbi:hypothetical protein GALL_257590 [mine drainage metagenome]|uniref:Uncharacterized protein n=1 Tax=mine drainage metagenome TaxID=410659 RepID=A0A1J5RW25_9ZZZZ